MRLIFCAFGLLGIIPASGAEVSYRNDVMAVLSKAGCNAGACHGNKSGKAGFKLSLRGQEPDQDFNVLTRDLFARRTNPVDPDQSLMLLKAVAHLPHEGGVRFARDSDEYRIIRRWIEIGTPNDGTSAPVVQRIVVSPPEQVLVEPAGHVQLSVTAFFSDSSQRDVTKLAVYEQSVVIANLSHDGLVERQRDGETSVVVRFLQCQDVARLAFVPARPDFRPETVPGNNYIDEHVFAKLKTLRMNPSGLCSDSEYLRRAYLDLLGILPTAGEAKAFLADESPDKRSKLIDQLLERPEYADFWALKWSDLLRNEERTIDRKGVQAFHHWIRQSIAANKPLDQFVRELVSGRGSTYENPPANYYRALRDPVTRGETTAQLFLGTRLQCAQCHNHPFDRWTQDDYFGWADVFSRLDYKILENLRRDKNDQHEFAGQQIVYVTQSGEVKDPRGGKVKPKLLGTAKTLADDQDRLEAMSAWLTSSKNPLFARSQVNRIWANLMGRGLVDPVDDFRPTNPASHPALLDALTKDFVEHGFDVRFIIRLVISSRAYGLSSEPNDTNIADEVNYSHAIPRRLSAEQLLDAQHQVAEIPAEFAGYPKGIRAGQIPGVRAQARGESMSDADQFLVTFGKPPRLLSCECERSNETTLGQTFDMISGPEIDALLTHSENRIARCLKDGKSDEDAIDELFWAALARAPESDERNALMDHVRQATDRRKGLEDVAWALLNAKEFVLRK